jgi:hypothetical protein
MLKNVNIVFEDCLLSVYDKSWYVKYNLQINTPHEEWALIVKILYEV